MAARRSSLIEPSSTLSGLRAHTPARIALDRSGLSLPTRELLKFGVAHARARDAVHAELDIQGLAQSLQRDGWGTPVCVASAAADRSAYLARPDWGRKLDTDSVARLTGLQSRSCDLAIVISDGLSAHAVVHHALALLNALAPMIRALQVAPVVIATQARVALADEIGEILGARVVASVIGERPGLSTPDSLGVYLTARPRVGRTDAERDCISNIHAAGLGPAHASEQVDRIIRRALQTGETGVGIGQARASLASD